MIRWLPYEGSSNQRAQSMLTPGFTEDDVPGPTRKEEL